MKRSNVMVLGISVLAVVSSIYWVSGYQRGRIDFEAVRSGKSPVYASERISPADGGTVGFSGRGYTVYQMHRILRDYHPGEVEAGFLGGSKIEWNFPIRIFARDDDSYYYIPHR